MTPPRAHGVTVVTVTYGQRQSLLEKVLSAARDEGVGRVVAVDNGASWPVRTQLVEQFGTLADVVTMGRNTGSAGGFSAGIRRAMQLGAEYIWLLDDDNCPAAGSLSTLLCAYHRLLPSHAATQLAVLAFRPGHQSDLAAGVPLHRTGDRRNAFRGFHVGEIPYKVWRRTPWGRPQVHGTLPEFVALPVAPYSGLLFHRSLVDTFGLPREDFVLYADDTEYSYRITRSQGSIVMVTAARIEDIETSWNVRQASSTSFAVWLTQGNDLRVYYGMRNGVYFDAFCRPHDRWMLALNRRIYLFALWVLAIRLRRMDRFRLVMRAVTDGLTGRLGVDPGFPVQ